jgi:RNA polymerase primary sigma factor
MEIPENIQNIINTTPRLKEKELKVLLRQYRTTRDNKIKEKIVNSYLWLVVKIAKKFYQKYKNTNLELSDIIEEGIIGLLKAINRHRISQTSFRIYAEYWIKQSIQMFLKEKPFVIAALPPSLINMFKKWFIAYNKIFKKVGRTPTLNEIAKKLKISYNSAKKLSQQISLLNIAESLATPVGDDATIEDFIEDKSLPPEEILSIISVHETLDEVLKKLLTKKEIFIIKQRYQQIEKGVLKKGVSYRSIAKMLHVSPENVRQAEKRILAKLASYIKYKLYI